MLIPFYGIKRFYEKNSADILNLLNSVYVKGQIFGDEILSLEKELAAYFERRFAVTAGSCTDALFFALKAGRIKEGDEVLVSSFSFIASASCITRIGAVPIFVDIDPDTFLMDMEDLKKKITPKTKAIIGVHLFGQSFDIHAVDKIAKQHNILFIEDAAQGFGSISGKTKAGSLGKISCLSFDPTKVISAFGSGGAMLTDDDNIYRQLLKYKYHGKSTDNDYEIQGYNSRLSAAQCALLSYQLKEHLSDRHTRLRQIAERYNNELAAVKELILPFEIPENYHIYHKYVIRTDERNGLSGNLKKNGISTMIHYPKPLNQYSLFHNKPFRAENITTCSKICSEVLSLPIYPELTDEEIMFICKSIKSFF
ncbi:MAG: DegT/DnrJ/EryC1/StrS family aminotransferase [Bacteroidota bacterium]